MDAESSFGGGDVAYGSSGSDATDGKASGDGRGQAHAHDAELDTAVDVLLAEVDRDAAGTHGPVAMDDDDLAREVEAALAHAVEHTDGESASEGMVGRAARMAGDDSAAGAQAHDADGHAGPADGGMDAALEAAVSQSLGTAAHEGADSPSVPIATAPVGAEDFGAELVDQAGAHQEPELLAASVDEAVIAALDEGGTQATPTAQAASEEPDAITQASLHNTDTPTPTPIPSPTPAPTPTPTAGAGAPGTAGAADADVEFADATTVLDETPETGAKGGIDGADAESAEAEREESLEALDSAIAAAMEDAAEENVRNEASAAATLAAMPGPLHDAAGDAGAKADASHAEAGAHGSASSGGGAGAPGGAGAGPNGVEAGQGEVKPGRAGTFGTMANVALAATLGPLERLPVRTRQSLGWIAVFTAFNAGVVWSYGMLRTPPAPPPPVDIETVELVTSDAGAQEARGVHTAHESAGEGHGGHEGGGEGRAAAAAHTSGGGAEKHGAGEASHGKAKDTGHGGGGHGGGKAEARASGAQTPSAKKRAEQRKEKAKASGGGSGGHGGGGH